MKTMVNSTVFTQSLARGGKLKAVSWRVIRASQGGDSTEARAGLLLFRCMVSGKK